MQRITFSYPAGAPTDTVEFDWGLEFNAPTWKAEAGSILKRAFDGTPHSQIKRTPNRKIPLVLNMLTETERDDLINFIQNVVAGRYRIFRYTDQDSVEHDVRFLDENFDFGDGAVPYSLKVTLLEP